MRWIVSRPADFEIGGPRSGLPAAGWKVRGAILSVLDVSTKQYKDYRRAPGSNSLRAGAR
jgi:hypothetical protein